MQLYCERNWQFVAGVKRRTRGWQIGVGPLTVRYGVYFPGDAPPDVRVSVYWRAVRALCLNPSPALLFVVFPRADATYTIGPPIAG